MPTSASDAASVPAIRTFQFDPDGIGVVRNSVNLFRGDVSYPLQLASLPGRNGLDLTLQMVYDSNVRKQVETWNLDAPTGIAGLGWAYPLDSIVVEKGSTASSSDDTFYLQSSSGAGQLVPIAKNGDGSWTFQLSAYQFWKILYFPGDERWEITDESGVVSIYGGKSLGGNAIQWGVQWNNWIGSSAVTQGQTQFARAWNLRQTRNTWGDAISYDYDAVLENVGSASGLQYTKASYLHRITDTLGRTVTFGYGEKDYVPGVRCEYQDPHKPTPNDNPDAYQSRYETRFLDRLEVANENAAPLFTIHFTYDFFNSAGDGNPLKPFMVKRLLTGVFQQNPGGDAPPPLNFRYAARTAPAPGALEQIVYPSGAEATYTFTPQQLSATRDLNITNPITGSKPRVWWSQDYVVITWQTATQLRADVWSWRGKWVAWNTPLTVNASVVDGTLEVVSGDDWFAVLFQTTSGSSLQQQVYLHRRDKRAFGQWTRQSQTLPLAAGSKQTRVAAGQDFLLLFNGGFTSQKFAGWYWDWRTNSFQPVPLPSVPLANPPRVAIGAGNNFYITASYNGGNTSFQLRYRDAFGAWQNGASWSNSFPVYDPGDGNFLFEWSVGSSWATATYITAMTSTQVSYELRLFQWDANFGVLNASSPVVKKLTAPVTNGTPGRPVFDTETLESLVGNTSQLLRYVGPAPSTGWLAYTIPAQTSSTQFTFALGEDAAAQAEAGSGQTIDSITSFNPNQPTTAGFSTRRLSQTATGPALAGNFLIFGSAVYYRGSDGVWTQLASPLTGTVNAGSVRNRGTYAVWETGSGSGTNTSWAILANGTIAKQQPLGGGAQRVIAGVGGPGTELTGVDAFVTYPSSQSFDGARSLHLYRVIDNDVSGILVDVPVGAVQIDDGYSADQPFAQAYRYDTQDVTVDAASGIAQYPKITTLGGVTSGNSAPQGYTETYYSNGLSQSGSVFYPVGWILNYETLLNGIQLATIDYDSSGRKVAQNVNFFQLFSVDATGRPLYGGYFRPVKAISVQDGVTLTTVTSYDATTGLAVTTATESLLGGTTQKTFKKKNTYAWEISAYREAFLSSHVFTAIAEAASTTDDALTSATVTTWKNWDSTGATSKWAPEKTYVWTGKGSSTFDYSSGAPNPGWLLTNEIVARVPQGSIAEQRDVSGVPSSTIYDLAAVMPVATFPAGSLTHGELAYSSFESYETAGGWTPGAGSSIVSGTAHSGTAALSMPSGSSGPSGSFASPAAGGNAFFSCWVQTAGTLGGGNAGFSIAVRNGSTTLTTISVPFPSSPGAWTHLSAVIPLVQLRLDHGLAPGSPLTMAVSSSNASSTGVLLDDVGIASLEGNFTGRAFDPATRVVTAAVDANGGIVRTLYDGFQRAVATTGPDETVLALSTRYSSRRGNDGVFNPLDPNAAVDVRPAAGGFYENLVASADYQRRWTPAGTWSVAAGQLVHSGTAAGTLTLKTPADFQDSGIRFRLFADAALQKPVGISVGAYRVTWNPATGQWELTTPTGTQTAAALSQHADVDDVAALDGGDISPLAHALRLRGRVLSTGTDVATLDTGERWLFHDEPTRRSFSVIRAADGLEVAAAPREWLLLIRGTTLLFYADGKRIFSFVGTDAISGPLQLFVSDPVAYDQLLVFFEQRTGVTFLDGAARSKQQQLLFGGAAAVKGMLYDEAGNAAVTTKAATVMPDANHPLFGWRDDFITAFDWTTGVMQGLVATLNPDDEGYPYSRVLYEASPLNRQVEQGLPGREFAIDLANPDRHTSRTIYGASDGSFGLAAGQYYRTTSVDADGKISETFTDKTNATIVTVAQAGETGGDANRSWVQSRNVFDAAGNVITVLTPNYFLPPEGSDALNWTTELTYDYLGRTLTRTTNDFGIVRFAYDKAGKLRFQQDIRTAAEGQILYSKYDILGRLIENGTYPFTWNQEQLDALADDPAWPPAETTWSKRLLYDGDGTSPFTIGRLWKTLTNNEATATPDVVEDYAYDVYGNIVEKGDTIGSSPRASFGYTYDMFGDPLTVRYPVTVAAGSDTVVYAYDELGRMESVGSPGSAARFGTFTWTADGQPLTQTLNGDGVPITTTMQYLAPGWPTSLASSFGGNHFGESLEYTSGGYEGAGYFTGLIAQTAFSYSFPSSPSAYSYSMQYDELGQLQVAASAPDTSWSLGVGNPLTFDHNGNILTVDRAGTLRSYDYLTGKNILKQVTSGGGADAAFTYYDNGPVETATRDGRTLSFQYDLFNSLTTSVTGSDGLAMTLRYDGNGQRVVKSVVSGGVTTTKQYLRGRGSAALVEQVTGGSDPATTVYVHGPSGVVAFLRGSSAYYVLVDHLGSTRVVLDENASVVAGYDYLPFGGLARAYGDAAIASYLFTGQEYDAELTLYNYVARLYDPAIGRFYAPDPARQYFSPYVYAGNNPMLMVDPTGQASVWEWIGFAIAVALTAISLIPIEIVTGGGATPLEAAVITDLTATGTELAVETAETLVTATNVVSDVARTGEGLSESSSLLGNIENSVSIENVSNSVPLLDESDAISVGNVASSSRFDATALPEGRALTVDELPDDVQFVRTYDANVPDIKQELSIGKGQEGLSIFQLEDETDIGLLSQESKAVRNVPKSGERNIRTIRWTARDIRQISTDGHNIQIVKTPGGLGGSDKSILLPEQVTRFNNLHFELRAPMVGSGKQSAASLFNKMFGQALIDAGARV